MDFLTFSQFPDEMLDGVANVQIPDEQTSTYWAQQPSDLGLSVESRMQHLQQQIKFLRDLQNTTPDVLSVEYLKRKQELEQLEARYTALTEEPLAQHQETAEPKKRKARSLEINKADRSDARRLFGFEFMCIACKVTHYDQQTPDDRFKSCILYKKAFCLTCGTKSLSALTKGEKKGNGKYISNDTSEEAKAYIRTCVNEAQHLWKVRRAGALLAERGLIANFDQLYKQLKDADELDSIRTGLQKPRIQREPKPKTLPPVDHVGVVEDVAAVVEELHDQSKVAGLKSIQDEMDLLDDEERREKVGISYQLVGSVKKLVHMDYVALTVGQPASAILQKATAEERISARLATIQKSVAKVVVEPAAVEKVKLKGTLLDAFVHEQLTADADLTSKAMLKKVKKHFSKPNKSYNLKERVKQIMKDLQKKKASRSGIVKLLTAAVKEDAKFKFTQALEICRQKYSDVDREMVAEVFAEVRPEPVHKEVHFSANEKEDPQPSKRRKRQEKTVEVEKEEPQPKRQKLKKHPKGAIDLDEDDSDLPTMTYLSEVNGASAIGSLKSLTWPKLTKFFASVHPTLAAVTEDFGVTKKTLVSKFVACFWLRVGVIWKGKPLESPAQKPESEWPAAAQELLNKLGAITVVPTVRDKSPERKKVVPKPLPAKPVKTVRHGMFDVMAKLEKMLEIDFLKDPVTGQTGKDVFMTVKRAVSDGLYDDAPIEWKHKLESLCTNKEETAAFGLEFVKNRLRALTSQPNATRAALIECLRAEQPNKKVEPAPVAQLKATPIELLSSVQSIPKKTCEWWCDTHANNWIRGCSNCNDAHITWHMRNEDDRDAFKNCHLCGPERRRKMEEEEARRKQAGIEKRKKTIAAKKTATLDLSSESSSSESDQYSVDLQEVKPSEMAKSIDEELDIT